MPPGFEYEIPRAPPRRSPITRAQASSLLQDIRELTEDYLYLAETFDDENEVVAAAFRRVGLLRNYEGIQDALTRAIALRRRIENSYRNNPKRTRNIQENYDQLVRIHTRTRRRIDWLRDELERSFPENPSPRPQRQQPRYQPQSMLDPPLPPQPSSRPRIFQEPPQSSFHALAGPSQRPLPPHVPGPSQPSSRLNNPSPGTAAYEILRLRDENRSLQQQNDELYEELAEARETIRRLARRQGREDGREDMRGEKRRRRDDNDDMRGMKRRRY